MLTIGDATNLIQSMTATREQIVAHILQLTTGDIIDHNWGFAPADHPDFWDVDDDTYINGVPLIIDHDLRVGFLVEIAERDTKTISYVVVVQTTQGHHSDWYQPNAGTFHNPAVDYRTVARWAVEKIYNLMDED